MSLDPRLEQLHKEVLEILEQKKILTRKYYNNLREIAVHPHGSVCVNCTIQECIEAIDNELIGSIENLDDTIYEFSRALEKSRHKAK